ncbi:hypothetical protein B0H14DRAFT_2581799 [Mycena olivaceomarginata]|nr:hypothetical protein B0H14DRAFT_2581799 [Mycena olivaceomarginata]
MCWNITYRSNLHDLLRAGLAGSHKDYEQYKSIQRAVRDLALNARINWELPWKQIPVDQKSAFFDVARQRHPHLGEFHNDWATEELVKQWMKNRRSNAYKRKWILNKIAKAGAAKKTAAKKKIAPKTEEDERKAEAGRGQRWGRRGRR